jgi:hypothetical protein
VMHAAWILFVLPSVALADMIFSSSYLHFTNITKPLGGFPPRDAHATVVSPTTQCGFVLGGIDREHGVVFNVRRLMNQ